MKTGWRKRLALGLCLVLLLGMLPTTALADTITDNPENITLDVIVSGDTMNTNNGMVMDSYGTVTTNNGTISYNYGTVMTNNHLVGENSGTVNTNNATGTMLDNFGTVENNAGTIKENYSKVTKNTGTVIDNYGGTVNNKYSGTVTNNYYEVTVVNGDNAEIPELKNIAGKTWIKEGEGTATITPKQGYQFLKIPEVDPAENATATPSGGGYSLSVTGEITLTLSLGPIPVTSVSLEQQTLSLASGRTAVLTATVLPADAADKAVSWNSDNEGVATVDENGKVTAVSPGTATITVTTQDGGFTAECIVTVPVPVAGVSLDKTALTMDVNDTYTLQATVTPPDAADKTVSWSSSAPAVAAVDGGGKVTAKAPGAATITVTTRDGGKTAQCAVTVREPISSSDDDDEGYDTDRETVDEVKQAKDGDTVELDLPPSGKIPNEVLEAAAGKDITLEIDAGNGVTWIINGQDIPKGKLADLNLKVDTKATTIPVTVINAVTGEQQVMQMTLSHDGAFPFPLTLRLDAGKDNANLWANLYYYDEAAKALLFQAAAQIAGNGDALLPFDHASSYAVVIDEASHAPMAFADVQPGDWCYEAVEYVHGAGLMQGATETAFRPNGPVTRGQLAAILWRMADAPAPAGAAPFADVPAGAYYADAVAWCAENSIVGGYGNGAYGPNDPVNRQQLVTILYRYAKYAGRDVSVGEDTNILSYPDALTVAEWAIPAFQWACGSGVVGGTAEGLLAPAQGATRAQLAVILQRFSGEAE